jgi:hypothetical protein
LPQYLLLGSVALLCGGSEELTYSWTRESLDGPSVSLDLPSSASSTLVVPAHTFAPNTEVTLQLVVAADGDLTTLGVDYVGITHILANFR